MGPSLHRLGRGRGLRWAATVALALVAGTLAATTVQRAQEARAAYGETGRVPVAVTDLPVGAVVGDADVVWADLPRALLPDGVAGAPTGRVVTEPVVRGEVLVERRLSGPGADGVPALVAPGRRALAVPLEVTPPGLAVGDRVEAYAPSLAAGTLAEVARSSTTGARRIARDALVVAVDEQSATISVGAADAAMVAGAVLDGALTLALVAPG